MPLIEQGSGATQVESVPVQFTRDWSSTALTRRGRHASALALEDRSEFNDCFPHEELWAARGMDRDQCRIYLENPHLRQVFACFRHLRSAGSGMTRAHRAMSERSIRIPYQRRRHEWKTVEHWGQRKLLVSEVEFLARFGGDGYQVVYAGGAPGQHIHALAEMFPSMSFVLFDPAPFAVRSTDRVRLVQDFFTDETAQSFARGSGSRVLFISDVRSYGDCTSSVEREDLVKQDMADQYRWTRIMRPSAAMLKFRLPYEPGATTYFEGEVLFPVWGGRTTSETRLIVTPQRGAEDGHAGNEDLWFRTAMYDHEDYGDAMYAFNTVTRTTYFEMDQRYLTLGIGYDHCYDCAAEIMVLEEYLHRVENIPLGSDRMVQRVGAVSQAMSAHCTTSGRTLLLENDIALDHTLVVRALQQPLGNRATAASGAAGDDRRDMEWEESVTGTSLGPLDEEVDMAVATHDNKVLNGMACACAATRVTGSMLRKRSRNAAAVGLHDRNPKRAKVFE